MKTVVFYKKIQLYDGITMLDVLRRSHALGFELVPFNGYSDDDLGVPGNRGPRWNDARRNMDAIKEIVACLVKNYSDGYDCITIWA